MSQGPKKKCINFLGGGFTPAPPALLVIRVVLLHKLYGVLNPFIPQLYVCFSFVDQELTYDSLLKQDSFFPKRDQERLPEKKIVSKTK